MRFCEICENMFYIKIDDADPNTLVYYCRNCGNTDNSSNPTKDNYVSKVQLKNTDKKFVNTINKYTKLDPTLPRINNILCPNAQCTTNHETTSTDREIIYIRYDDTNMKYMYLCSTCDVVWETTDK